MSVLKWRNGNTWKNIVDLIFPIGTMFLSQANTSPAGFVGGTWAEFNENRFLIPNKATGTGGSWTISVNQMPVHQHCVNDTPMKGRAHLNTDTTWNSNPGGAAHMISASAGGSYKIVGIKSGQWYLSDDFNVGKAGGGKIITRLIDSVIAGVGLLKNQVIAYG